MFIKERTSKILSMIVVITIIMGVYTPLMYAEGSRFSSLRIDLEEEARGKIRPEVIEDFERDSMVEVLVYMKDQVDTNMVALSTKNKLSSYLTPYNVKLAVRKGVVEALRDKAETSQSDLLDYLSQEKERGNVEGFISYNIVNMVYIKATRDVIESISYMTEVSQIYKNETHQIEDLPIEAKDIQLNSSDPEWNINRVNADQVWEIDIDGSGAVVAILDSGVDWTHPALKHKWRGYNSNTGEIDSRGNWFDPVYNSTLPTDSGSHGTHVMGTILGEETNGSNKIGVAPGAKWIAAKVFNTAGSTTDAILLSAAEWVIAPGGNSDRAPDVVNNSWGGLAGINDWFRGAVNNWRAAGIVPIFSAGNQRPGEPAPWPGSISVPSNYPESFAVAATDKNNKRGSFSKLGPSPYDESLIKPEISAPGVAIRSSVPGGGYANNNGTSMAAPHIAGVVALLVSANNSLSVDDIENIIMDTAKPLTDTDYPLSPNFGYGYGLVDAFEAISQVTSGTGFIEGRVLYDTEDFEDPIIIHEQEVFETFAGADIEIFAQMKDDVSILEASLLVEDEEDWVLIPMERVSGDYKDGIYKGKISQELLNGDRVVYKISAKDYAGDIVVTEDYYIDIKFGLLADEYNQGFEDHVLGWQLNGSWEWGQPSNNSPKAYEGEKLVGTNLSGNYPSDVDDWMITPPIDLRNQSLETVTLRYHQWYDIELNYDKAYVLASNDYGESWREVGPIITGESKGWQPVTINLADYIGSREPVFIAFRLTSDFSNEKAGWYIDNLKLVGDDLEAPAIPSGLNIESTMDGLYLSWSPVKDGDLSHYNVYRSLEGDDNYILIDSPTGNSLLDREIEEGLVYYYKITSEDYSGNESDYSEVVSILAPVRGVIIFGTDFEGDNGGFTSATTMGNQNPWRWGIPTSGPYGASSGERLWATNLSGNYNVNTNAYIESPIILLPNDKDSILKFNHWYDIDGIEGMAFDYGQVQLSKNGGNTWINITPTEDGKYSQRSRKWLSEEISLAQYKGEEIKIRFFFYSDDFMNYSGWYIDDVYIVGMNSLTNYPLENLDQEIQANSIEKESYELIKAEYKIRNSKEHKYERINNEDIQKMTLTGGPGIPLPGAIVTILESGRSIKTDPLTGKFKMRSPIGEYTIKAEAYGFFSQESKIIVENDEIAIQDFLLEAKPKGDLSGRVFDRYYGDSAPYATIRVVEDNNIETVIADENGEFTIEGLYQGDYTLKVTANGFESGEFPVSVVGEEVNEVEIALKRFVGYEREIIYDDGTGENALVSNDIYTGLAVRFTPDGYGKVVGGNLYFWDDNWPVPGGTDISVAVYDIDENGSAIMVGRPKVVKVVRGAWNYVDLSEYNFFTDRDFYISTLQVKNGDNSPGLGLDRSSSHADRSYINIAGEFSPMGDEVEGIFMIRARVESVVDVPIITNLDEITYTNQDRLILEGELMGDGKVNIYLNDEKTVSVATKNGRFSTEVDIIENISYIKATAELNGKETEPSSVITVKKDKESPIIEMDSPKDNIKINSELVHIAGRAWDNFKLESFSINDVETSLDQDGNFYEKVVLEVGRNVITIKARDKAGNETIVERTIDVDLETPTISNIQPSQDIVLKSGERLTISFEAPQGGQGYFRLMAPFNLNGDDIGIAMVYRDGRYEGYWNAPSDTLIDELLVEVVYISEHGTEVMEMASGKVKVITDEDPVDPEPPYRDIENIEPSEDVILGKGETVQISFNGPSGGDAYFRLVLSPTHRAGANYSLNHPMIEGPDGFYSGSFMASENLVIPGGLEVEVILVVNGRKLSSEALGKIFIIGDMGDLPDNSIIIGNNALDSKFLDNNQEALKDLNEWINKGGEVYIKLRNNLIVNERGEIVSMKEIPRELTYYSKEGKIAFYKK